MVLLIVLHYLKEFIRGLINFNKSSDKLILIGARNELNIKSVILFARNIRSISGSNFGKRIGYFAFYIDQEILSGLIQKIKLGDTGYFFIMDKNGNILSHNNEDLTQAIFINKEDIQLLTVGLQ